MRTATIDTIRLATPCIHYVPTPIYDVNCNIHY